jgi:hypothetical protein
MTEEETKQMLVKMFRNMIIQGNQQKELLAKKWGIK